MIYVRKLGGDDKKYDVSVRCQIPGEEYDIQSSYRVDRNLEFGVGFGRVLPGEFLRVRLELLGDARRIEFCPVGERPRVLLDRVRATAPVPIARSGGGCAPGD